MKKFIGICISLSVICFFSINTVTKGEGISQITDKQLSLMFEKEEDLEYLLEITNVNKNNIDFIEEIGLAQLNNLDSKKIKDLLQIVEENNINVEIGDLPELVYKDEEQDYQSQISTKKYGINSNQFVDNLNIISPELNDFNWYVRDVTSEFNSYNINKGENSTIALIDSGVDINHPTLYNNIDLSMGKDFTLGEEDFVDEMGHGTSVAGVLNVIAPDATIVPYKVLGAESGESSWVLQAIVDAANKGVDIINLSLGTYKSFNVEEDAFLIEAYERAIDYALEKNSLVVASAGNYMGDLDALRANGDIHLPGGLEQVMTVTSNTKDNNLASYSNYGSHINFSAPGGDLDNDTFDVTELIVTTYPIDRPNTIIDQIIGIPNGFTLSMGTSLSAPQVSATAAIIKSEFERTRGYEISLEELISLLEKGAYEISVEDGVNYFGSGKINAFNSLRNIMN